MKKKRKLHGEKRWIAIIEVAMLIGIGILSVFFFRREIPISFGVFGYLTAGMLALLHVFMAALDAYKPHVTSLYEKGVIIFLSSLYSFVLVMLVDLIFFSPSLVRIHLITVGATAILLFAETAFFQYLFSHTKLFPRPRLLIIETNNTDAGRMRRIKYGTMRYYDSWYESIDTSSPEAFDHIFNSLGQYNAVCLLDSVEGSIYRRMVSLAHAQEVDLFVIPKLGEIGRSNARMEQFDDLLTMHIPGYRLGALDRILKRVVDILFSAVFLALAAIPMLIIAAVIKLTSPGPVFYCQERLTRDKKPFMIYKFRTMVPDAEKLSGPVMAQKHDPRITPIGRFLRACRLDELPQLINILKGDMSVVGPRPERPFFVEQFEREMESYHFRYAVKAGLTSLSHVYGRYSTYIYDRTCYDLMYITHYSFWLDIKIMLLTSKIVFLKSAAEGEDEYKRAEQKQKVEK